MKKTFEINGSKEVLTRFERFLALLHYNSIYGHTGIFAMELDGDGVDRISVSPTPRFAKDVQLIGSAGPNVEVATNIGYYCKEMSNSPPKWSVVRHTLYKNGVKYK